jgi:hypothetical protein
LKSPARNFQTFQSGSQWVDVDWYWLLVSLNIIMHQMVVNLEGSDTAEISYTRLRNQLKSNPKSRKKLVNFEIRNH